MDLLGTDDDLEELYSFNPDVSRDRDRIEECLEQFKGYTSESFSVKAHEVSEKVMEQVVVCERESGNTYSDKEIDIIIACTEGYVYCHYLQWMVYFEESERLPCTPWMFSPVQQTAFPAGLACLFRACHQCVVIPGLHSDKEIRTKELLEYVRFNYSYQKAVPFITKVLAIESRDSSNQCQLEKQTDETSIPVWQERVVLIISEMRTMLAAAAGKGAEPDICKLLANRGKCDIDQLEKKLKRFTCLKDGYNWSFFTPEEIRKDHMVAGVPCAFSMKSALLIYREFLRNEMEDIVWEHWHLVMSSGSLLAKLRFENPSDIDEKKKLYDKFCKLVEEGEYDTRFK